MPEKVYLDYDGLNHYDERIKEYIENKQLTAGNGVTIINGIISSIMNATNTYSKEEVDDLLADLEHVTMHVSETRPATGESNVIYLIGNDVDGYEQWVYVDNSWYDLGSTTVDLSDYLTATQVAAQYQAKLSAGTNITLSGNTISATDTTYAAGTGITITGADNTIAADRNATNTYTKTEVDDLLLKKITDTTSTSATIASMATNRVYVYTQPLTDLTITAVQEGPTGVIFKSGSTATNVTLPATVVTPDGYEIKANKTYEFNIMNNLLVIGEW